MKSIEFGEDRLQNLSEIAQELFNDDNDPRSISYVRELKRPSVNWFKICLWVVLPPLVLIALAVIMRHIGVSTAVCVTSAVMILLGYIIINLKRTIICAVKIYQRYAPSAVRNKCRFEPSCSEYMILSIEKYGLVKGLKKGVNRLKRCNINDGGIDFP